jgi:hypothetical protein
MPPYQLVITMALSFILIACANCIHYMHSKNTPGPSQGDRYESTVR